VPNTDHSLKGSDAYETLQACYSAAINNTHLPEFSWTLEKDGAIRVTTKDTPAEVKLWQATNPEGRDFRLEMIGPAYKGSTLTDQGGGVYVGKVLEPSKGWTAFFVELTFPNGNSSPPLKFTTQVRVVPDVLPHKFVPKGRQQ
jgi:PhoPQ-activated pathogenicity-related protein